MPFGLGWGEALIVLVFVGVVWGIPLAVAGRPLLTLATLRTGQDELLRRVATLERRLGGS